MGGNYRGKSSFDSLAPLSVTTSVTQMGFCSVHSFPSKVNENTPEHGRVYGPVFKNSLAIFLIKKLFYNYDDR